MFSHFSTSDDNGCGFYRMGAPARHIVLRKWEHTATLSFLDHPATWRHAEDICVIQRQYSPDAFRAIEQKRQMGIPVVGELDDDLFHIPTHFPAHAFYAANYAQNELLKRRAAGTLPPGESLLTPRTWLANFLRSCDALTVPTQALSSKLKSYNKHIYVLPNYLDDAVMPGSWPKPEKPGTTVRILWAGGLSHKVDMIPVFKALVRVMAEDSRIKYIHVGPNFEELGSLPKDRIEVYPMTGSMRPGGFVPAYYRFLQQLPAQIALAPLEPTTFALSKSWIKALEYGMAGYYPVLQDYAPYQPLKAKETRDLIGWVHGWTEMAWKNAITQAVEHISVTQEKAETFQTWVHESACMSSNIDKWVAAYKRIIDGPRTQWFPNWVPVPKR